jgi:hypothetical protein
MKQHKYLVGIDPYEKPYSWWEVPLVKLGLRKNRYHSISTFELVFDADYFQVKEVLSVDSNQTEVQVLSKPQLTIWSKIRKLFGFKKNLSYFYDVKIIEDE